jgi:hypothetical protein
MIGTYNPTAKLIIDNRLTNQNLTEPQVRIQKGQDSIEVSLPGVANSSQILEIRIIQTAIIAKAFEY